MDQLVRGSETSKLRYKADQRCCRSRINGTQGSRRPYIEIRDASHENRHLLVRYHHERRRLKFVVSAASPMSPKAFPEPQKANDEPVIETA
ncbi:MAG: hypothetical protein VXZ55_10090, partial [Planctomycetota bacterium]|nr:hypothetical protein [Planctomycetota bacterium]